ncbi:MAG: glycosyltransferase [Solirubrobacteraceae bacterium]
MGQEHVPATETTRSESAPSQRPDRRTLHLSLTTLLALAAMIVPVAVAIDLVSPLYAAYTGVSVVLLAIAMTTLVWMLDAWRTPGSLATSRLRAGGRAPAHSFSLIVPARHEDAVLEVTLSRLIESDHPAFEVLVVVGVDDPRTRQVAERVAAAHPRLVRVIVDDSWPKSKPKALNAALPHCTGSIVGVFDAEDDVHPALLRRVDDCLQSTDADIVQAGVQLMNFRSSWLTVRNVLEYYFWFRSRLHRHARQRFIPLGGNTVFVRTAVLEAVGGWDPDCLAEDCELGVRLSALGAHTAVFYEPELVTREECPPTLGAFVRQRTRWNQGYLQTLSRGHWRRLPLGQRMLGAYILGMPFLMALAWLLIPGALISALALKAPVGITLVSFLPLVATSSILLIEIAALGEFGREYGERPSRRDYVRLVLGFPLYQLVLTYAAARAVMRELRGARGWEKTTHLGLHLPQMNVRQALPVRPVVGPAGRMRHGRRSTVGVGEGRRWAAGDRLTPEMASPNATHSESRDRVKAVGGGPLWLRMAAAGADGSSALSLPSIGIGRRFGDPLADLGSLIRRLGGVRVDLIVQAALLAVVAVVLSTNLLHWPNAQFDEGTYVGNAWAVQHGVLSPYTYSYGHPPLAWLAIFLWSALPGIFGRASFSIDGARVLMVVVSLVSSSLVYTLARRMQLGRAFAAAAVVVFALSPLGIFYHRAVLLDNPSTAWALGAFVLALTPQRRLWAFAASGACFGASVLSKETSFILLPPLVIAAAMNADKRTARYCITLFGTFLAVIVLSYPFYAILKGELLPGRGHVSLVGYTIVQLFTRQGTGSAFDASSQTHAIIASWLNLDAWLLFAPLVLLPIALMRRSTRAVALALALQVAMVLRPGYLPNMYVIGLLPFAALTVMGALDALWRLAGETVSGWRRGMHITLLVALMAAAAMAWGDGALRTDRQAMTVAQDVPRRAAERWLVGHMSRSKRLIVTDDVWIYLIEHGFDAHKMTGGFYSRTIVSYWPLDYDPAVKKHFPGGWRSFDYIVVNQDMRVTMQQTPSAAQAVAHSRVIARFGGGSQLVEVRAISPAPGAHAGARASG